MLRTLTRNLILICVLAVGGYSFPASAQTSESPNIRTIVYNPNEVFLLTTKYGYQSNIEFSKDERIKTISIGEPSAFRLTPNKNRLFVKALQPDKHTNLTIITDKRSYQFELFSKDTKKKGVDGVVYVLRFYYPQDLPQQRPQTIVNRQPILPPTVNINQPAVPPFIPAPSQPPTININKPQIPPTANIVQPPPTINIGNPNIPNTLPPSNKPQIPPSVNLPTRNVPPASAPAQISAVTGGKLNYNYTITGPDAFAPVKIFDNGSKTYLKFNTQNIPSPYIVTPTGDERPAQSTKENAYLVVNGVFPRLSLRVGGDVICVFNEATAGGR